MSRNAWHSSRPRSIGPTTMSPKSTASSCWKVVGRRTRKTGMTRASRLRWRAHFVAEGKLHIDAGILLPTARDFHNGSFEAHVKPQGDTIAFEDDGGSGCKVRMQRIGPWLLIEDDGGCG